MPQGKVLNHDFVNNFMNEALAVAYDSETTGERKLMSLMLDRERTGMQFNDEVPFEMFRSSVARSYWGIEELYEYTLWTRLSLTRS